MLIRYTDDLARLLKQGPSSSSEKRNPLYCWSAHVVSGGEPNSKLIVMINDAVELRVAFPAPDNSMAMFHLLRLVLKRGLAASDIPESVVDDYFTASGPMRTVWGVEPGAEARLANFAMELVGPEPSLKALPNPSAKRRSKSKTQKPQLPAPLFYSPHEEFAKKLARLNILNLKELEWNKERAKRWPDAIELECRLKLRSKSPVRRLIIPYNINFNELSEMINVAFQWRFSVGHFFYFYQGPPGVGEPSLKLFSDDAFNSLFINPPQEIELDDEYLKSLENAGPIPPSSESDVERAASCGRVRL